MSPVRVLPMSPAVHGTGLGGEKFRCICPPRRRLVASLVDGRPPAEASALMAMVDAAVGTSTGVARGPVSLESHL
jgi:hypothetical protein